MNKLIFQVTRKIEHGYTIDNIWISEYSENNAAERLAGTVDNKDGYGDATAAARMGRLFQAMVDAGVTTMFDWSCSGHSLSIRSQVFENPGAERPSYCQPNISLSSAYKGAAWGLKLVEKLGRMIERKAAREYSKRTGHPSHPGAVDDRSLEQVQDVIWALKKMGAVEVERFENEHIFVPVKKARAVGAPARPVEYELV